MSSKKLFTLEELSQHDKKGSLYVAIKGKVYDVSKFIDEAGSKHLNQKNAYLTFFTSNYEHPGGEEVLLDEAGRDATDAFEDVGHSEEALEILKGLEIGEFVKASATMSSKKLFTFEELSQHNKKGSLYVAIKGKIYDISKFIDEHPGGEVVLLDEAGRDATDAFKDVGHSGEALEILKGLEIGELIV
ncbi:15366_t:CDS:2 [Cetraspora pellucida]|uniref:15366_t:CDS:1 n=1 Tax=Cetraspora pellucida TaxID=1433469 RepID=A0A9N9H779_9GLOM|nr:15366_t:CDS:2 [Cetraspora pellucida]